MGVLFRLAGGIAEVYVDLRRLAILQLHLLLRGRVQAEEGETGGSGGSSAEVAGPRRGC